MNTRTHTHVSLQVGHGKTEVKKKTVHMKCIKDATYEEEIHKIQPITVLFVKDLI